MKPINEPEVVDAKSKAMAVAIERMCAGTSVEIVFTALSMCLAGALRSIPAKDRIHAMACISMTTSEVLEGMEGGEP